MSRFRENRERFTEEDREKLMDSYLCNLCNENHEVFYGYKILDNGHEVPAMNLAYVSCEEYNKSYFVSGEYKRKDRG